MKHEDLVDPDVAAWSRQLTNLFISKDAPVGMPLFEDNFPCPTTVVTNYGAKEVTAVLGTEEIQCWGCVNGAETDTFAFSVARTDQDLHAAIYGPNVSYGAQKPVGLQYIHVAPGTAMPATRKPSTSSSVFLETLRQPFEASTTSMEYRTCAYAVRVTFIGKLTDTEGFVEFAAPWELPKVTDFLSSYKRDVSHKLKFFSSQRTHTFNWAPACNDVIFAENDLSSSDIDMGTRFLLRIGGLAAGDKLLIEVIKITEYTGALTVSTQQPRRQSPDATHVLNAMVTHNGHVNDDRGPRFEHVVGAHKMISHPWLRKAIDNGEDFLKDATKAAGVVKAGAKLFSQFF